MPERRQVTLMEVAKRAGVSPTTASYILNGRAAQMRISADAEHRVKQAVADLGYRPNLSARSLRTSRTQTIGVISDFVASGQYASAILSGAGEQARALDHVLIIGESEGDPALEAKLIDEMLDRRVDGLLYVTLVATHLTVPDKLRDQPVVLLNCEDPDSPFPAVLPDDFQGGRTAGFAVLEARRHQRAFVVGEDPTTQALAGPLRLKGIRSAMSSGDAEIAGVVRCDWNVSEAYDAVDALLSSGARPTALICLNDRVALGAYQALGSHGCDIPGDVAVVSFDASELAGWLRPTLSSVALPFKDLGATAVRRLLRPEPGEPQVVRLPMPLFRGGSMPSPSAVT